MVKKPMWKVCALLVLVSSLSVAASTQSVFAITQEECKDLVKKVQSGEMTQEEAMAMKDECMQYSQGQELTEEQEKMKKEMEEKMKNSSETKVEETEDITEDAQEEDIQEDTTLTQEQCGELSKKVQSGEMTQEEAMAMKDECTKLSEGQDLTEEQEQQKQDMEETMKNPSKVEEHTPIPVVSREYVESPRKQINEGTDPTDVVCNAGKELVIRISNDAPLCLNPSTAERLVERGMVFYP